VTELNTVLERLIRRDDAVRGSGQSPDPRAEANIIEFINQHELYANESARRWLVDRAETESYRVARELVDTLAPLIQRGYHADALSIFCRLLAHGDIAKGAKRRNYLLGEQSMFQPKIKEIITTERLVSDHVESWGRAVVKLQADLLLDGQVASSWRRASAKHSDEPDYEDYSQRMFFEQDRENEPVHFLANAIESGLTECLELESMNAFQQLASLLISTKWGLARSQPLIAIFDVAKEVGLHEWQCEEARRLLSLDEILVSRTAYPWRRLLRCYLLPRLGWEHTAQLAGAIRRISGPKQVDELSEFEGAGVLTEAESAAISAARSANELFAPHDPRDLRTLRESREASRWVGESFNDDLVKRWPFPDEHSAIRLLVERMEPAKDLDAKNLERELFGRLSALQLITARNESSDGEWLGEVLEWCGEAISDLKLWIQLNHGVSANKSIPLDLYVPSLQEHCPWWNASALSAVKRLSELPPHSHFENEQTGFSYGGGDPIAGSLKMLDELLAIPDGSQIDKYKHSLHTVICDVWSEWPLYTRGLAVWLLRPYHWRASNEMMDLLVRAVEFETDSEMVSLCLNHLLLFRKRGLTPLMRGLLGRVNELSEPTETSYLLGEVIGDAVIRYRASGEDREELQAISEWFNEIRNERGMSVEVRKSLLTSLLNAAERRIALSEQQNKKHASEWVALTCWRIGEWLDSSADGEDTRHLPSGLVRFARHHMWSSKVLRYVLSELHALLIRIVRSGGLGEFYFLHFELNKNIENKHIAEEISSAKLPVVAFMSDDERLAICRASVNRVAEWRREGKTTNDLAYGSSLSGQDSKELILNCFKFANDRDHVRREFVTLVDALADANLRHVANELRTTLRQAP
jgi:hypothetical protein